ncbi:MAG: eight-cysteine-cluster domain-containing protein [Patescibacteria group bacterium]
MKKQFIVLAVFALVTGLGIIFASPVVHRRNQPTTLAPRTTGAAVPNECDRDVDCVVGGCSQQLCVPRDQPPSTVTTCEWRDEYACYEQAACGCQNHRCQWSGGKDFTDCVQRYR